MNILTEILKARENRADLRKKYSLKQNISFSLTLNIPGYPKTNEDVTKFFFIIEEELKYYLNSFGIIFQLSENMIDEAGNIAFYEISEKKISATELKNLTEKFESEHKAGRVLDIDVCDENGNLVSSGKHKKCFICDEPAIFCMRENKHDKSEIRNHIFNEIRNYINENRRNKIVQKISEIALKSMLYEVSLTPKPGLVDFKSSGSHKDMNFFTFLNSTASLSNYFTEIAEKGYCFTEDYFFALPQIRNTGLKMETAMFEATNNVNTQKGLIFLLGLSVFATANLLSKNEKFEIETFSETVKKICKNLTENELSLKLEAKTHGEKVFKKYGLKAGGARLEAEFGFPTVFKYGLPVFEKYFDKNKSNDKKNIENALQRTLFSIISKNNDTNILFRKDEKTLENLKNLAKKVLNNEIKYSELIRFCKKENISPGGSADLLVVSTYLFFIKSFFS